MGNYKSSWEMMARLLNIGKPYLLMLALQAGGAGQLVISQFTLKQGMSRYVLIVYRNLVATLVMAPFALLFDRKRRPKLTIRIFLKILACAILEAILDQNFTYMGMNMTTATCTSAILNAAPAVTFVLAVILRLERVKINEPNGLAKVLGTLVTFGGALIMTMYKGPIVPLLGNKEVVHNSVQAIKPSDPHKFVLGTIFVLIGCFSWASFFVMQTLTLKDYPAELSLSCLICLLGSVLSSALTLVVDRRPGVWSIGLDSRLLAPVYTGLVASGMAYYFQGIVMRARGPVFATAFNPLCMIIVAVLSSFVLSEQLRLGSIIGAVVIVIGLYAVLWGKSKDLLDAKPSSNNMNNEEKDENLGLPITRIDGIKLSHTNINGHDNSSAEEVAATVLHKMKDLPK